MAYRAYADENLKKLFERELPSEALDLIEIGINHEQQHQELMLTDILALFAANPLRPAYRDGPAPRSECSAKTGEWVAFSGGIYEAGHNGAGFSYDNEGPRHRVLLHDFRLLTAQSRMANGMSSWKTAATRRHRFGSLTAGRALAAKIGMRRDIGKSAMARGIR